MQEAGAPFAAVIVQLSELGAIAIELLSISARDEKPIATDAVDVWAAPNIVTEKFEDCSAAEEEYFPASYLP